jgi:hypothetical protein
MKSIFFKLPLLLVLFIPIGCGDVNPTQPIEYTSASPESAVQTISMVEPPSDKNEKSRKPQVGSIFQDLLIKLKLTNEQKPLVETLLKKHKECAENCVRLLKDAEREILMNAKIKRDQLKKDFDSGKITREEYRKLTAEIRSTVSTELKTLPEKMKIRECLQTCDSVFINALENILSPDQKIVLRSWLETRSKRGTSTGRG